MCPYRGLIGRDVVLSLSVLHQDLRVGKTCITGRIAISRQDMMAVLASNEPLLFVGSRCRKHCILLFLQSQRNQAGHSTQNCLTQQRSRPSRVVMGSQCMQPYNTEGRQGMNPLFCTPYHSHSVPDHIHDVHKVLPLLTWTKGKYDQDADPTAHNHQTSRSDNYEMHKAYFQAVPDLIGQQDQSCLFDINGHVCNQAAKSRPRKLVKGMSCSQQQFRTDTSFKNTCVHIPSILQFIRGHSH